MPNDWVPKTILTYHFQRNQKQKTKIEINFFKKMKIFMPVVGWESVRPVRPSDLFFAKFFPKPFQYRLRRAQAPGFAGIMEIAMFCTKDYFNSAKTNFSSHHFEQIIILKTFEFYKILPIISSREKFIFFHFKKW